MRLSDHRHWLPRPLRYGLHTCIGLSAIALFFLFTATANTTLFTKYYPALLAVNGALVVILAILVIFQLSRLGRRLRRQEFGSRLALRFVLVFALMSLLPGAVIYAVSVKFLARSIDSWFEVRLDKALEGGLNLGRGALDSTLKDIRTLKGELGKLLNSWQTGDMKTLIGLLNQALEEHPALYKRTLSDRNKNWVPRIEELIRGNKDPIVIVGAAHLAGKGSVIELLEKNGIKAVQQ